MSKSQILNRLAAFGVILACLAAGNAWSDDSAQSKERIALRKVQQQMQQLKQEKATLEEKLAGFEKEKADLQSSKEKSERQLSAALSKAKTNGESALQTQAALDAMVKEKSNLEAQKSDLESRLKVQTGRLGDSERALQISREEARRLNEKLRLSEDQLTDSDAKNFELYKVGRDLIEQCRTKSFTDVFLRLEPFTRIKGVEIENQLEQYRDRLDNERRRAASNESGANAP
jgi:chromosome segregation ATPase